MRCQAILGILVLGLNFNVRTYVLGKDVLFNALMSSI